MISPASRPTSAALVVLIILQTVMLAALFAGVRPHPPESIVLFGIAPFIGVAIATAVAALIMDPAQGAGRGLSALAALFALLSLGPQKYMDPQFPLIWPAVIAAQIAVLTIVVDLARSLSRPRHMSRSTA